MEGWGWQKVHHPDHIELVTQRWKHSIAEQQPFEMIFPLRGADGIYRSFLTRIVPAFDHDSGKLVGWYGSNTEVTAQLKAEEALVEKQAQYDVLTEAMPQMVWSTLPDGYHDYYNDQWYDFTGVPRGSTDGEAWNGMFHPDDQQKAWGAWRHSLATGDPYEIEYRLRHKSGRYKWTLGRARPVRNADGKIVRWIGTCTDIDDAKRANEQNEILTHELSHRIKNIFAIVSGLTRLSARHHPEAREFGKDLSERIASLGRAHEFARPHSDESRPTTLTDTLAGLILQILMPYQDVEEKRIRVSGETIHVDDKGATPIALIIHELATNAGKYGSLSVPEGTVRVLVTRSGDKIEINWQENGGPDVEAEPTRVGFGSTLASLSVQGQLDGTIDRVWIKSGLQVKIAVPERSLHR